MKESIRASRMAQAVKEIGQKLGVDLEQLPGRPQNSMVKTTLMLEKINANLVVPEAVDASTIEADFLARIEAIPGIGVSTIAKIKAGLADGD